MYHVSKLNITTAQKKSIKSDMCVLTDSIPIEKNKKKQYQSIWIRDLEDGAMMLMMTLDLLLFLF